MHQKRMKNEKQDLKNMSSSHLIELSGGMGILFIWVTKYVTICTQSIPACSYTLHMISFSVY